MPASAAPALADRAHAVQDKFAKVMACVLIMMMAYCALNPDQATINKALIALAILAGVGLAAAIVIESRDVKAEPPPTKLISLPPKNDQYINQGNYDQTCVSHAGLHEQVVGGGSRRRGKSHDGG
jgi:hypothetical protein